jgi:hypothetical protein
MSATADSQERWQQFYEEATLKSGERERVEKMLKKVETRRLWDRILMVGSTAALVALTSYFYNVLTRY